MTLSRAGFPSIHHMLLTNVNSAILFLHMCILLSCKFVFMWIAKSFSAKVRGYSLRLDQLGATIKREHYRGGCGYDFVRATSPRGLG